MDQIIDLISANKCFRTFNFSVSNNKTLITGKRRFSELENVD